VNDELERKWKEAVLIWFSPWILLSFQSPELRYLFLMCSVKTLSFTQSESKMHYFDVECFLNLNSVNQLIFVMVKCGVLFEVRTEFLNNI
jgi:hypothetical protein